MAKTYTDEFIPLTVSILTVSDTRNRANDTSGNYLADAVSNVGHNIREKAIVVDNIYKIRSQLSSWIADEVTQVIIITGGTGFTERDSTPEAVIPLFDKTVDGFGELFRQLSYDDIGTSTI
ncbi:molybdenum cofactor synthesis domain-containing protein, partial [Thalassolituus oleivorans]